MIRLIPVTYRLVILLFVLGKFFHEHVDQRFLAEILSEFAVSAELNLLEVHFICVLSLHSAAKLLNDKLLNGSLGVFSLGCNVLTHKIRLWNVFVLSPGAIVNMSVGAALQSESHVDDAGCDS